MQVDIISFPSLLCAGKSKYLMFFSLAVDFYIFIIICITNHCCGGEFSVFLFDAYKSHEMQSSKYNTNDNV